MSPNTPRRSRVVFGLIRVRFEMHELFLLAKSSRALAREVFGCQLSQYTHPAEGCIRFTPRSMCFNYFIWEKLSSSSFSSYLLFFLKWRVSIPKISLLNIIHLFWYLTFIIWHTNKNTTNNYLPDFSAISVILGGNVVKTLFFMLAVATLKYWDQLFFNCQLFKQYLFVF
jgi:hypothetical protein